MLTDAQIRARAKYRAKNKRVEVEFNEKETDLIDYINTKPSKQAYIKSLIRDDMGKHNNA